MRRGNSVQLQRNARLHRDAAVRLQHPQLVIPDRTEAREAAPGRAVGAADEVGAAQPLGRVEKGVRRRKALTARSVKWGAQ